MRKPLITILVLFAAAQAWAQQQPAAEQFGDWGLLCQQDAEDRRQGCRLFQNAFLNPEQDTAAGQEDAPGKRLLHTAVGFVRGQETPFLLLTAPLGILLPQGVALAIDDGEPVRVVLQRCDGNGCLAVIPLEDALLEAMRKGEKGSVTFYDPNRQAIKVPLSLKGFTKGFAALVEAVKAQEKTPDN